ncbi:dihydrofolate reductase family protein [Echinicola vietnamensis]|uniref:Dihydrofolate reductase n=1 Tax=Echinicola vietnamensis (strain DSM 17526 / LMG 23754 / KMM 6221) TaxID=926556 RepID=L0FXB7_ECHVK|nr:dihydrofolate reductase family protein [Echinicola vietnamensis]AGA77688.1 dihydrofolate reductase [Echinicola vietnamensis DSM 17526]
MSNHAHPRKIILSMMVSLDGYSEGEEGDISWHRWNEEMDAYMMDFFPAVDTFIYGRKSYELMLEYWPDQKGEFAQVMNDTPKLVFSKTLEEARWNGSIIEDVNPQFIHQLKAQQGKDLVLFAGANLAGSFIRHHLIDEYRFIINPVVLGKGNDLFQKIKGPLALELKASRQFSCGNTLLHYIDPLA